MLMNKEYLDTLSIEELEELKSDLHNSYDNLIVNNLINERYGKELNRMINFNNYNILPIEEVRLLKER